MFFKSLSHGIKHCAYFGIQIHTCSIIYAVLWAWRFIFVTQLMFAFWFNLRDIFRGKQHLLYLITYGVTGVDTNFEKLETVGLPTHNFQQPQVKFRSHNLFFFTIRPAPPGKSSWHAIGVSGHNIANVEVDFYMLHSVIYF